MILIVIIINIMLKTILHSLLNRFLYCFFNVENENNVFIVENYVENVK